MLLGENNAGKCNVTRVLIFSSATYGPAAAGWTTTTSTAETATVSVEVRATVSGISCPYCQSGEVSYFKHVRIRVVGPRWEVTCGGRCDEHSVDGPPALLVGDRGRRVVHHPPSICIEDGDA